MNPCLGYIFAAVVAVVHSQGPFGSGCPSTIIPSPVTVADSRLIVDVHNRLRSHVALGRETRGSLGPQPSAANMRAVVWDAELALLADRHVRQCVVAHTPDRDYGQNLFRSFSTSNSAPDWTSAIQRWYGEVDNFDSRTVNRFTSLQGPNGKDTGHYTQVVWAETSRVGCSVINWLNGVRNFTLFYTCNYRQAGNSIDRPIYLIGPPTSACPAGTGRDTTTGLCR